MNKKFLFFLLIIIAIALLIPFSSSLNLGVNGAVGIDLNKDKPINYSLIPTVNNSLYWDGNAWEDNRWLETDGSNSMTSNLNMGGNYINNGKFNKFINISSTESYPYGKINFPYENAYIQVGKLGYSNQDMIFHTEKVFVGNLEFTILNTGDYGFEFYSSTSAGRNLIGRTDGDYSLGRVDNKWRDLQVYDINATNGHFSGNITSNKSISNSFILNGTSISDWSEINITGTSGIWENISGVATYNESALVKGNLSIGNSSTKLYKNNSDLVLENLIEDGKIVFKINNLGNEIDFMEIDPSIPTIKIGSSDIAIDPSTSGLFNINGKIEAGFISALIGFNPTVTGQSVVSFLVSPKVNSTGLFQVFRFTPQYTADNNHKGEMLYFEPSIHSPNRSDDFSIYSEIINRLYIGANQNDDSTTDIDQFTMGGPWVLGDFGSPVNLPDITEDMITLNGGASRLISTLGSVNQKGLVFKNFGSQTALISGTDSVIAMTADGGQFEHKYDYTGIKNGLFFGAGNTTHRDSSMGYNGTDFIINPKLIGSGAVIIEGNTTVESNLDVIGSIFAGDGYTGYCVNMTYVSGIAISCND